MNNTAVSLASFNITYDGEQWRRSANASQHSLQFSYQISGSAITGADAANAPGSGGWTAFTPLDLLGPQAGGGGQALDGNAAANRATISATLTGVTLAPGEELFLRWFDLNDSGNNHHLGIDNVQVSYAAVPEPAAYALAAGLGLLGFAAHRRWSCARRVRGSTHDSI